MRTSSLYVVVDVCDVVAVKHFVILERFVGGAPLKLALLVFPAASPPSFTTRMIRPTMSLFTTKMTLKLLY